MSEQEIYIQKIRSNERKFRAKNDVMKITYFSHDCEKSFHVGVLGSRNLPYILNFSPDVISCSCPDFSVKKEKPICKHIFLVIHLARNNEIFNSVYKLEQLFGEDKFNTILSNLLSVIDKKKMELLNSSSNTISIEKDDCCSICYTELDGEIGKCIECEHVLHKTCLIEWWKVTRQNNGRCPYCRSDKGLSHLLNNGLSSDPWDIFNFKEVKTTSSASIIDQIDASRVPVDELSDVVEGLSV